MRPMNALFSVALGLAITLFVNTVAQAATPQIQVRAQYQSDYTAGTSGAKAVARWLQDHAAYANGQMLGDLGQLGAIHVTFVGSRDTQMSLGGEPPVPLPASGHAGDTITVTSCGGGSTQSWTYVWVGNSTAGGWQLESYSWIHTTSCARQG